jgi:DNA primase
VAYRREDIDAVRDKTDLAELASEVTKVKRSGRSTMAVCPFHSEKTPSLSIDAARGLYHCFGCGKSGDVYRWVQETQGLDFAGAVEFLARRAGFTLTVDPAEAKSRGKRERLVEVTRAAVAFYTERLKTAPDAGAARGYLRSRGYDADVVDTFSLGYSPDGWDNLVNHLRDLGTRDETMIAAGLASRSSRGGLIDRFRGRVMFPIFDVRGDAVGFGARVLDGDGPKYLNSSESAIYHKSRLLYGLNWAKSDIVRQDTAVVVEGYTDVIAMHLAGMPIAVATCGTALGEDHLDLLRRFSERVVFAFDADEAGAGAALRGFDRSVPGDLDLRIALLPDGKDPADVVAAGDADRLRTAIAESEPLLKFRIETELSHYDLDEPEARAKAVRAAASVIALHPDPVTRHEYAVLVSRSTGVELRFVESAMRRGGQPSTGERPPAEEGVQAGPATAHPNRVRTGSRRSCSGSCSRTTNVWLPSISIRDYSPTRACEPPMSAQRRCSKEYRQGSLPILARRSDPRTRRRRNSCEGSPSTTGRYPSRSTSCPCSRSHASRRRSTRSRDSSSASTATPMHRGIRNSGNA